MVEMVGYNYSPINGGLAKLPLMLRPEWRRSIHQCQDNVIKTIIWELTDFKCTATRVQISHILLCHQEFKLWHTLNMMIFCKRNTFKLHVNTDFCLIHVTFIWYIVFFVFYRWKCHSTTFNRKMSRSVYCWWVNINMSENTSNNLINKR